jgi:hypothetical protein
LLQFCRQFGGHKLANLASKRLNKQASAHTHAAMDSPHGKREACFLEV